MVLLQQLSEFVSSLFDMTTDFTIYKYAFYTTVTLGSIFMIGDILSRWKKSCDTKRKQLLKRKKIKPVVVPKWAVTKMERNELEKVPSPEEMKILDKSKPPEVWNNVIFFPGEADSDSNSLSPLQQLKGYFREAKISIYLCMYLCSLHELSDVISEKYREGLVVQVVTDYETWTAHNNKGFKTLWRKGIPVRLIVGNGCLMHHKFAIIDDEASLTGSLNWTKQGAMTNRENVMITTNPQITKRYLKEFNKLWRESKDPEEADAQN